jgi:hypothetical protein
MNYSGASSIQTSTKTFYDFKINHASCDVTLVDALTVTHDLTIEAGELDTSGSNYTLTVNGDLLLHPSASAGTNAPSTLTCNDSDITVGGKLETQGTWSGGGNAYMPKSVFNGGTGTHSYQGINFLVGSDVTLSAGVTSITGAVNGAGAGTALRLEVQSGYNTYSNGSGTVKFTSPNDQRLYSTGQQANNWTQFHNLTLEKTSSTLQGLTSVGFHIKVANDLLITSGILKGATNDGTNHDLTAGSLTIASGGEYSATSGTTTITGENTDAGVGSGAGFAWDNLGTFTHNNGKVVIDTAGNNHTLVKETTFYDLEVNQTSSIYEAKFRPKTGTHSEILNNFTLTSGIYEMHADGDTLDIHGLTTIEANGQFLKDAEHTGLVTHHGLVTNRGAYMLKDGVTVKMNGGFRQLGTFTTP